MAMQFFKNDFTNYQHNKTYYSETQQKGGVDNLIT